MHRCNPVDILEMATKIFFETILYNKSSNFNCLDEVAGFNFINAGKIHKIKHEGPSLSVCLNRIPMFLGLAQSGPPRYQKKNWGSSHP